jgi:tetratricopeptide (TPR) repeat protein
MKDYRPVWIATAAILLWMGVDSDLCAQSQTQRPSGAIPIPAEIKGRIRDPNAINLLAQVFALEDDNRWSEAIDRLKKILDLEQGEPKVLGWTDSEIAGCYGHLNRFVEEAAWGLKAVAAIPKYARAHINLGSAYIELRQFDRAIEEFNAVVSLDPKDPMGYYSLGLVAERQGDFKSAELSYRQAVEADPTFADAHFNLAALYANQRKYDQAIAELRRVLEIDPLAEDARSMLHELQTRQRH